MSLHRKQHWQAAEADVVFSTRRASGSRVFSLREGYVILWGEPGEYGLCGVPLGIRGSRADFPQDISCPRCEKLWNTFYAQKKEPRDITRERRFRAIRKKCSAARKADMKALGKRLSLF